MALPAGPPILRSEALLRLDGQKRGGVKALQKPLDEVDALSPGGV